MTQIHFPIDGVVYPSDSYAHMAYREGLWLNTTVGDLVRSRACASPKKVFILTDSVKMTYAEFDAYTEILAASLHHLGLLPGDRAIFQMGTIPETLIALFACYKAGLIPVCTLPQHREFEISAMIRLTKPRIYFVQADFDKKFDLANFACDIARKNECIQQVIVARRAMPDCLALEQLMSRTTLEEACLQLSMIAISPNDVLTFQLSGGSTDIPKIIPRFHGEYLGQAYSMVRRHRFTASDIAIWPLPLIHNAAMLLVILPILLSTGTVVLQQRFEIQDFVSAIKRYGVSFAGSIGPIASSLLDYTKYSNDDLNSLRMFFALDRADAIENQLKIPTMNLYGITEGLLMTCSPDDPSEIRFKTVGYPSSNADQIKVLLPETEQENAEGELCFRGPHTLCGYFNAAEISAKSFTKDGFFRSGDLVCRENFGGRTVYRFLGRLKDNISRGGEKFAAEEVERLVALHPAIADVKIVAMPDRYLGEKACAFIILKPGQQSPTVKDLDLFLSKQGLARYKHPEHIEIVDAFPLTQVGKADKKAMRKIISDKLKQLDELMVLSK